MIRDEGIKPCVLAVCRKIKSHYTVKFVDSETDFLWPGDKTTNSATKWAGTKLSKVSFLAKEKLSEYSD